MWEELLSELKKQGFSGADSIVALRGNIEVEITLCRLHGHENVWMTMTDVELKEVIKRDLIAQQAGKKWKLSGIRGHVYSSYEVARNIHRLIEEVEDLPSFVDVSSIPDNRITYFVTKIARARNGHEALRYLDKLSDCDLDSFFVRPLMESIAELHGGEILRVVKNRFAAREIVR